MADGGIHDHVGGGFHRYSTDAAWLLPHFEKMLYDNALLLQAYAGMHARTGEPAYARVAERIVAWLEREMKQPGGGYASSLDADTEGEEGTTYTWTEAELEAALGEDDARFAAAVFGFLPEGNFRDEATGERTGRNIVHLPRSLSVEAAARSTTPEALGTRLDDLLARMLPPRTKRPQPGLDDKVITGWNALLVSGFVRAGVALERPEWIAEARALADHLLTACRRDDGTLLRFPKDSGPEIVGFCEDHVHLIEALLDLADATGDDAPAAAATDLGRRLVAEFQDDAGGGFWTTSDTGHESLFARSKESMDTPIPSDNGTAVRALLRLHARTNEPVFREAADRALAAFRPMLGQPRFASMLVQLFRALRDRDRLEAAGAATALVGDVHVRRDVALVDGLPPARDRRARVPGADLGARHPRRRLARQRGERGAAARADGPPGSPEMPPSPSRTSAIPTPSYGPSVARTRRCSRAPSTCAPWSSSPRARRPVRARSFCP